MSFASRATGSFVSSMRDSRVFLRPRTTAALTDTARCARADASPLSVMDGPLAPSRATAVAQRSKHSHEVGWWGGHMTGDAPKWKGGGQAVLPQRDSGGFTRWEQFRRECLSCREQKQCAYFVEKRHPVTVSVTSGTQDHKGTASVTGMSTCRHGQAQGTQEPQDTYLAPSLACGLARH